jgi:hypothetical protein
MPKKKQGGARRTARNLESERDQSAASNEKTEWIGSADSAAYDPPTEEEKRGASILGGSSIRDGAIPGVSDPVRDGRAGPHERADDLSSAQGGRRSPDEHPRAGREGGDVDRTSSDAGDDR